MTYCGLGFDSRRLHQEYFHKRVLLMGANRFRRGGKCRLNSSAKARSRRIGDSLVEDRKTINAANDAYYGETRLAA